MDQPRRRPGQYRPVAHRKEGQAKIAEAAGLHDCLRRQADDGVVAVPPGEFVEEMYRILRRHRQLDGDQQFLRRQRRLIDSGEKIRGGNPPFAGLAAHDDGRVQRHHAGRQFGRRVGVGEAAAERAPVADRRMRDMGDGLAQQGRVRSDFRRAGKFDMARQRADGEDIAAQGYSLELGDRADIDHQFRTDQPQIHRGHQALATGQQLGAVAMRDQELQRVGDAGGACVGESRGFHRYDLPGRILAYFAGIRGRRPAKVKFVYRTIISADSTFGLVISSSTTHGSAQRDRPKAGAGNEPGFFHDADPSSRQGLAAVPQARSRSFPPGRRTRIYRSLCRRTRHRQGREHHLLHRISGLGRRRHPADPNSAPAPSTCRTPIPPRSRPAWRCSTTCSTGV